MNTTFLKNFVAVAETNSISAAARQEHIAQSALSLQLKTLEDELGCSLLKRSRHGVSLSDEGEIFYHYARRILGLENELKDRMQESATGGAGVLRIGVSSSCLSSVLAKQLRVFERRFPSVRLEIYENSSTEVLAALRNGSVDVGVIKAPAAPVSDMCLHFKSSEPMAVLYESRKNYFSDHTVSFAQLKGVPLCAAERSFQMIKHMCALSGFEPVISVRCEQFETAAMLALHGRGAAVVPMSMALGYLHYSDEDKRSYFNAERVRVLTKDGKRIYPEICDACDAMGHFGKCSVVLEKGFDGYILYPLNIGDTIAINYKDDVRVGLTELCDATGIFWDGRLTGSVKGQKYAIGGFYLTDNFAPLSAWHVLEDFSDGCSIADDYHAEDLHQYGQKFSAVSVQPAGDLQNAMVLTVPEDGQMADIFHCSADWVSGDLVPNIDKYRYLVIRIINPDIERIALSVGLTQISRLRLAEIKENVLDTAVVVLSCSDRPLSPLAAEFVNEFN